MSWLITGTQKTDPDAASYLSRVETADGQALEPAVRAAIEAFVLGCKADGIWSAIKASCILAGARTLSGCLVPLVGTAPTNFNFVAGDYNRKTGLVGNGGASGKYISTGRANNADPRDSQHLAVYATSYTSITQYLMGAGTIQSGDSNLGFFSGNTFFRSRYRATTSNIAFRVAGTIGMSRSTASTFTARIAGSSSVFSVESNAPSSSAISVFTSSTDGSRSTSRLAFYSIGESLDLALLDSRVTTLINAIAAAIP